MWSQDRARNIVLRLSSGVEAVLMMSWKQGETGKRMEKVGNGGAIDMGSEAKLGI
jgi:hypothetical protein